MHKQCAKLSQSLLYDLHDGNNLTVWFKESFWHKAERLTVKWRSKEILIEN